MTTSTRRPWVTTDLALISTFAALVAACSLVSAPVGPGGVPVTLQTFAVLLTGLVLGPRRGCGTVALYVAVGLAGVPILAGGTGGLAGLVGPSAGYLLAFPVSALIAGAVMSSPPARRRPLLGATTAVVAASLAVYTAGVPVMAWRAAISLPSAFVYNLAFVPLDAVKSALAVIVALAVLRAFPQLRSRR